MVDTLTITPDTPGIEIWIPRSEGVKEHLTFSDMLDGGVDVVIHGFQEGTILCLTEAVDLGSLTCEGSTGISLSNTSTKPASTVRVGSLNLAGSILADKMDVGGDMKVGGNVDFGLRLHVTGTTAVGGHVCGEMYAEFTGPASISQQLFVESTLIAKKDLSVGGRLTLVGTYGGKGEVEGNLTVKGGLKLGGRSRNGGLRSAEMIVFGEASISGERELLHGSTFLAESEAEAA